MVRSAAVVIGMVLLLMIAGLLIASAHWKQKTRKLSERLETLRSSPETEISRPEMLKGLPAPVQRYFRRALEPGTPMVAKVRVRHRGSFNMAEDDSNWKPFTSRQLVNVNPPGFLWDAKISVLPGLSPLAARVHDGYIGGEGILHASLGGLIPLEELPAVRRHAHSRFRGSPLASSGGRKRLLAG
nr:DUF6544 family protein [Marispirochaeta sp.]